VAYFDEERFNQAYEKSIKSHPGLLNKRYAENVLKAALANIAIAKQSRAKPDYSTCFTESIFAFFQHNIDDRGMSAYRSFLGCYFQSFKKVKPANSASPQKAKLKAPIIYTKQTELFA